MTLQELKQISIIEYLAANNHQPVKIKGEDVWYLSPLRTENTASFKVSKRLNRWYDHGIGKGGSIIDLVMIMQQVNMENAIKTLKEFAERNDFSFHRQQNNAVNTSCEKENSETIKTEINSVLQIKSISDISDIHLKSYIEKRAVKLSTARIFCHQLEIFNSRENFSFNAIGLQNRSNGFEIRTPNFKACCAPKDFTFIDKDSDDIAIVEGFFDMLTAIDKKLPLQNPETNWLVLNSLNQTEKTKEILQRHRHVYLMLDNDSSGKTGTQSFLKMARKLGVVPYDLSYHYEGSKDLNDWAILQRMNFLNQLKKEEEKKQEIQETPRSRGFRR